MNHAMKSPATTAIAANWVVVDSRPTNVMTAPAWYNLANRVDETAKASSIGIQTACATASDVPNRKKPRGRMNSAPRK